MSKFVCSVCGYVYEGEAAPPAQCPHLPRRQQISSIPVAEGTAISMG